jgi:hypothetical protein
VLDAMMNLLWPKRAESPSRLMSDTAHLSAESILESERAGNLPKVMGEAARLLLVLNTCLSQGVLGARLWQQVTQRALGRLMRLEVLEEKRRQGRPIFERSVHFNQPFRRCITTQFKSNIF